MSRVALIAASEPGGILERLRQTLEDAGVGTGNGESGPEPDSPSFPELRKSIASADAVLLCWSARAESSFIARWQWSVALAEKKRIVVLLLDDAPLPYALESRADLATRDVEEARRRIGTMLHPPAPRRDPGSDPRDGFFSRWETRLSLVAALLAIVTFGLDLPQKLLSYRAQPHRQEPARPSPRTTYSLAGRVWDENGRPLAGVVVRILDLPSPRTDTTDVVGHFAFDIQAGEQRQVSLLAQKDGYAAYTADPILGNDRLEFSMRRDR